VEGEKIIVVGVPAPESSNVIVADMYNHRIRAAFTLACA